MNKRNRTEHSKLAREAGPQSFDQFFVSDSRVSAVQFWGLLILGINLIVLTVVVLVICLERVFDEGTGVSEILFSLGLVIAYSWGVYVGIKYIARAFRRRSSLSRHSTK